MGPALRFLQVAAGPAAGPTTAPTAIGTRIPPEMKTFRDPDTGRTVRQYTAADSYSYPLYYFTPPITADGRYAIIHSARTGWIQLYRLDLQSGEMVQLTAGATRDSGWSIWCETHVRGIYNHLSSLNRVRHEVYYFQDEEVRATDIESLANRVVLKIPGRMCVSQTNFSPDGRLFAFIHADRELFRRRIADLEALQNLRFKAAWNDEWRHSVPCTIGLIDTATGRYRDVIHVDFHIHHVIFADNDTLLVNHLEHGEGMWRLQVDGAGRRELKRLIHQVVTRRGIYYETPRRLQPANKPDRDRYANWLGLYDLKTDRFEEVPLPCADGYVHTGWDWMGKFLFFENAGKAHELLSLHFPFLPERTHCRTIRKLEPYPRGGQWVHAHPFLSPDRRWLFHTATINGISQVCAVDVADLVDLDEYWDRRA